MAYRKIGIAGATGRLGQEVTRVLKDKGFEVVPFSRRQTTVAGISTQKRGSLVGFDVVISTLGHAGEEEQTLLIRQAKRDGVKRYVPSEFGVDGRCPMRQNDFFKSKRDILKLVEELQFPDGWTAISCGFFDYLFPYLFVINQDEGSILLHGRGERKYPWASASDVAQVLAASFDNPGPYKNQWLGVVNTWLSMTDIAGKVEQNLGKKLRYEYQGVTAASSPVLYIAEEEGAEFVSPSELPVQLGDLEDKINLLK